MNTMSGHEHHLEEDPAGTHDHEREPVTEHGHDHEDGDGHEHPAGIAAALRDLIRPHSHDSATKIDSALESDARGVRALKISLVALLLTGGIQLVVVLASSSVGLFSDMLHNVADALTAVPIWLAFIVGRRLPTKRFSCTGLHCRVIGDRSL